MFEENLVEIKGALTERGIEAGHISMIWTMLRRLGLSLKNSLRAAEQDRPGNDPGSESPSGKKLSLGRHL